MGPARAAPPVRPLLISTSTPSRVLGPGEQRLLRGAIEGRTVDEQARLLRCTRGQLAYRRGKILRKLGARNITQAVAIALEAGLLEGPPRPIEKIGPKQRSLLYVLFRKLEEAGAAVNGHDLCLEAASERIGRTVTSVNDLSYEEASDAIEWCKRGLEVAA